MPFLSAIYDYATSFNLPERVTTTALLTYDYNRCTATTQNPPALSSQYVATRRFGLTGIRYDISQVNVDKLKGDAELIFAHKQDLGWKDMLAEMSRLNDQLIETHDRTVVSGNFSCGAICDRDYVGKYVPRSIRAPGYEATTTAFPALTRS